VARTSLSIPAIKADLSKRPLLEVTDLKTYFHTEEGEIRAVDGVSFQLMRGRTLAIVGESGCGKSVTAYSLLRLVNPPGEIVGGSVRLHGTAGEPPVDILALDENSEELYEMRGGRAAFIFQEASAALSPVHTVGSQMCEAIRLHQRVTKKGAKKLSIELLHDVGIVDPALCFTQYPHELSGGMRQRAMIAMALASDPDLLIADEPTTALDVTIQAQVLNLLEQLQKRNGMSILLITHDLGVVSRLADEVLVMYLGKVVERASVSALLKKPRHPYTIGLLDSLPSLTPVGERLPSIRGSVPSLAEVPPGCPFHPRCDYAEPGRCNVGAPPPLERLLMPSRAPFARASEPAPAGPSSARSEPPADVEHAVACWRVREIALERLLQKPLSNELDDAEAEAAAAAVTESSRAPSEDTVSEPELTPTSRAEATEEAWFEAGERVSEPPDEDRAP
jgi:oligopeptide/dipeptide ABC transporter ATP-binding protein